MKYRIVVYGSSFEKAKDFLEQKLLPSIEEEIIVFQKGANFLRVETETTILQTLTHGQRPTRCHELYYDKEEDKAILEMVIFPLANLRPFFKVENKRIPY